MTLYEFKCLAEDAQYTVTFTEGIFIEYSIEDPIRYALYAVDRFFVEVAYDSTNNNIIQLVSFIEGDKLNRYSIIDLF